MKILIDNSGYHLQNMGDVAMLQVAASRIREIFPNAELQTLTINPTSLDRYVGGTPLHANRRKLWQAARAIPLPVRRAWLSESLKQRLDSSETRFKLRFPKTAASTIRALGGTNPKTNSQSNDFVSDVESCDLMVATGGGFFTDAFVGHANDVLTTLELAQRLKKPVLLFGQGIGPLTCEGTLERMERVLRQVPFIGIREQKFSRPILASLGISDHQIINTGDDAIELAYERRPKTLGEVIGINLRVANYSGLQDSQLDTLRCELHNFCRLESLSSAPIPISFFGAEQDLEKINKFMEGIEGYSAKPIEQSPNSVADVVSKCRVVITGSYHAGVFALAQGIPVVGLAASPYYMNKFLGLQDQFGLGCAVVDLSGEFQEPLRAALRWSLHDGPKYRNQLLIAAKLQIEASRSLYRQAFTHYNPNIDLCSA